MTRLCQFYQFFLIISTKNGNFMVTGTVVAWGCGFLLGEGKPITCFCLRAENPLPPPSSSAVLFHPLPGHMALALLWLQGKTVSLTRTDKKQPSSKPQIYCEGKNSACLFSKPNWLIKFSENKRTCTRKREE